MEKQRSTADAEAGDYRRCPKHLRKNERTRQPMQKPEGHSRRTACLPKALQQGTDTQLQKQFSWYRISISRSKPWLFPEFHRSVPFMCASIPFPCISARQCHSDLALPVVVSTPETVVPEKSHPMVRWTAFAVERKQQFVMTEAIFTVPICWKPERTKRDCACPKKHSRNQAECVVFVPVDRDHFA